MHGEKGITLIEVIVSMVILLVGILAVIGMHTRSIQSNKVARDISKANQILHREIEKIAQSEYGDSVNASSYNGYTLSFNNSTDSLIDNSTLYNVSISWKTYGDNKTIRNDYLKSKIGTDKYIFKRDF